MMIDDPNTAGQESSLGGAASEWSTVKPVEPPTPPAAPVPPPPEAQSLEPLPPVTPPAASQPANAGGYQQVYGGQPQAGAGYAPPPSPPPQPGYAGGPGPQYPPPPPPAAAGQGLSSNAAAAISYITFIPAVLFLVLAPYNRDRFVRFHAWQCIALTIVAVGLSIVFTVLGVMGFHLLWWLFMLVRLAVRLVLFVFWLIALIKASQGQWYKIPIVGDLATSLAGGQQQ